MPDDFDLDEDLEEDEETTNEKITLDDEPMDPNEALDTETADEEDEDEDGLPKGFSEEM